MNEEMSISKPQNESVVVYQSKDGTLSLEVQIADETVWLTQQQMSVLFNVKENNITYHIQGIYKTHDLEPEATTQKIRVVRLEGNRSVARLIDYYNLDMIISVGYRVNSPSATQFRRWATGVLKEYLLRGYAVNQRIENLERRVAKTEEQIDFFVRTSLPPVEQVFYNGEFFEARVLLEKIIKTAKRRVIIIDAYVDAATFEMLDVRKKGVTATIYSGKDLTHLRDLHNESGAAPVETYIWKTPSHDRWLIVDDSVYHCGHSLKDMGRKLSAVSLLGINAEDILKQVR